MMLFMNWVDLVIILMLLFFALEAIRRPLIFELLDLASFLLAGILSFSLYNFPASFFEKEFHIPHGLTLVLGFMVVWFLSEAIFFLLVRIFIKKIPRLKFPGSRFISIIPAFLRRLIFIAIGLVMIATFPIQPSIKKSVLDSGIGSVILKNAYSLEQPIKQVFGGVANDSLTFLTIKPQTNERINLGFQTDKVSVDSVAEGEMLDLVNKERTSRGFNALVLDEKLRGIARVYSEDMLKKGYFSHYSPEGHIVADRALAAGVDFLVIGENLAYAPGVESAHKGLMNSEGHRANILSPDYAKAGIGAMDAGVYGKMFTQVFSN